MLKEYSEEAGEGRRGVAKTVVRVIEVASDV